MQFYMIKCCPLSLAVIKSYGSGLKITWYLKLFTARMTLPVFFPFFFSISCQVTSCPLLIILFALGPSYKLLIVVLGGVAEWLEHRTWTPVMWVQVLVWPQAGFDQGGPWFNSLSIFVASPLACLLPVAVLKILSEVLAM